MTTSFMKLWRAMAHSNAAIVPGHARVECGLFGGKYGFCYHNLETHEIVEGGYDAIKRALRRDGCGAGATIWRPEY